MTTRDDYRNATTVSLTQVLRANERPNIFARPYRLEISYNRDAADLDKPITAGIHITGFKSDEGALKRDAVLRVDGENFPVTLKEREGGVASATSYQSYVGNYSYVWISRYGRAEFVMPEEARQKLAACKDMSIRFYIETKAITFVAERGAVERVREFAAAR